MLTELFTIKENNISIIPVEFNEILRNPEGGYGGFILTDNSFDELIEYYKTSNKSEYTVFDLSNAIYADDRIFEKLNSMDCSRLVLSGVSDYTQISILNKIKSDLLNIEYKVLSNGCIVFGKVANHIGENLFLKDIYKHRNVEIVLSSTRKWGELREKNGSEWGYLVSSGVYSDRYIDIKQMFSSHTDTAFIIYQLYNRIREWGDSFDCILATSKTGVALAAILADIMNKELLCLNIGQMFEEIYDQIPKIVPGKHYVHIFDMICLGTEVKVANAMVSGHGGYIDRSFGVVCLQDLKAVKKHNRFSFLNKVEPLISYKDLDINYNISLFNSKNE